MEINFKLDGKDDLMSYTGVLSPSDREESAARCHICGSSLTYPEIINFGNRCLFCSDNKKEISMWKFLLHAYYDIRIYKKVLKWTDLKEECPDCFKGERKLKVDGKTYDTVSCCSCNGTGQQSIGRTKFLGYLGAVGASYYEQLTIKQKKELLKELGRK